MIPSRAVVHVAGDTGIGHLPFLFRAGRGCSRLPFRGILAAAVACTVTLINYLGGAA